jgi:pimeloyl-ACP methyl ester carboxylesterase
MSTTVEVGGRRPLTLERRDRVNDVELFYTDTPGRTPLILLHGLSANASSFTALIRAVTPAFRVIAPDLRGRARCGKPAVGYGMPEHARDVIALMDLCGIDRAVLAGHSFGGYLAIYLAAHYPERFDRLIIIDAAITSHPRVGEMLKPSLERLGKSSPSADAYLAAIRSAPYMDGMWNGDTEAYFRAELVENPDGTASSATSASAIAQAAYGLGCEPWLHIVQSVRQPALLINATGAYGAPGAPPLMEETWARATAKAFTNCKYAHVPGNHLTMMFGDGAAAIGREITAFAQAK